MENRFLSFDVPARARTRGTGLARSQSWARTFSATDRRLVILIENGGVDLGIPELVDNLLPVLPVPLSSSMRQSLVEAIRKFLKDATDNLLENFELSINRYEKAKPGLFGDVVILRNGSATYADLKRTLIQFSRDEKIVDLLILTHGSKETIAVQGGRYITGDDIRAMKTENGKPLPLRSVYQMNCKGSTLNRAWLDAGAKVVSGSAGNNYLPEPTTFFFWKAWTDGQSFETAATSAYKKTVNGINGVVREALRSIPVVNLIGDMIDRIDLSFLDFVVQSKPYIEGQGSLTISSDSLSFSSTLSSGLTTTVLPASLLRALEAGAPVAGSATAKPVLRPVNLELVERWERPESGGTWDASSCATLAQKAEQLSRSILDLVTTPLNANQRDALVSLVFQIGLDGFRRSTLLKRLNAGDLEQTVAELRKWTRARQNGASVEVPELVRRRNEEAELFTRAAPAVAQSLSAAPIQRSYVYHSPSQVVAAQSAYSEMQNPALVAGIELADAAQIGLAGVAIVQSGVQALPQGSFSLTYDKAQRLLTNEARQAMPWAQTSKRRYTRQLFYIGASRLNAATATVIAEWDGNDYGEIGTVEIRRDLKSSTEWSKSSAAITISRTDRIPLPRTDPRTWPIVFTYEGNYDPWGNGLFEFSGEFEVNAFGGLKFNRHEVYSRAVLDFTISGQPEEYVVKAVDVVVAVPTIPTEQLDYLRSKLP